MPTVATQTLQLYVIYMTKNDNSVLQVSLGGAGVSTRGRTHLQARCRNLPLQHERHEQEELGFNTAETHPSQQKFSLLTIIVS